MGMGAVISKLLGNPQTRYGQTRRYRRVVLSSPVRLIVNGIDEFQGTLVNISPGDLALKTNAEVVVGDAAVAYIKDIDVIEGCVARVFPDGFALSFRLSKSRRAMLTEKLMMRVNQGVSDDLADRRSSPRHRIGPQRIACRLDDGGSLFVKIIDRSVDGVAVESQRKPPVGASIHVGRLAGVVIRHTPRGFVVVYDHPGDEKKPAHLRAV